MPRGLADPCCHCVLALVCMQTSQTIACPFASLGLGRYDIVCCAAMLCSSAGSSVEESLLEGEQEAVLEEIEEELQAGKSSGKCVSQNSPAPALSSLCRPAAGLAAGGSSAQTAGLLLSCFLFACSRALLRGEAHWRLAAPQLLA